MPSDYAYDLFVSYPRRGGIPAWVHDVLIPQVHDVLDENLPAPPRIALDTTTITAGEEWPTRLRAMHTQSRAFLMVMASPFFRSGWCASEWRNAVERARLAGRDGELLPIVVPVRYNDLDDADLQLLPQEIQDEIGRITRFDFGRFTSLVNRKADTQIGFDFREQVKQLCEHSLARAIQTAPAYSADWPALPTVAWRGDDPRWRSRL